MAPGRGERQKPRKGPKERKKADGRWCGGSVIGLGGSGCGGGVGFRLKGKEGQRAERDAEREGESGEKGETPTGGGEGAATVVVGVLWERR